MEEQGEKCVETISGQVKNNIVLPDILEASLKYTSVLFNFRMEQLHCLYLKRDADFEVCLMPTLIFFYGSSHENESSSF